MDIRVQSKIITITITMAITNKEEYEQHFLIIMKKTTENLDTYFLELQLRVYLIAKYS